MVVAGFTVKNANFEGILATNASLITLQGNVATGNDKSLIPATPACPGIPAWETAEAFDCGEAIHLSGVDHSTVANNLVQNNAGGILLSDDTGATHDNSLTGNTLQNNPYDCGFVLASHPPAFGGAPAGVYTGNYISGNGADTEDALTPGPTGINVFGVSPITGMVISQNVIKSEAVDVAVNTPAEVDLHQNNLNGGGFGVDNLGSGTVNATSNWWGCAHGPGAPGCSTVGALVDGSVTAVPALSSPAVPNGH